MGVYRASVLQNIATNPKEEGRKQMLVVGLKRLVGVGLGIGFGSFCYAKATHVTPQTLFSGANDKFRTFFTPLRDQPTSDGIVEFEAQWNSEVEGSHVSNEPVQVGSSGRPEDVWAFPQEEVQQGLQQMEDQRRQQVLSNRQQQPLRDNSVSSTTPD